jgi:hypothetical protein
VIAATLIIGAGISALAYHHWAPLRQLVSLRQRVSM